LLRCRQQALTAGIKYVYAGNILDVAHGSTYCPACKKCLIERAGYYIGAYRIKQNRCSFCGELIAGVLEDDKGTWKAQRARVEMSESKAS
jgi:pyruvate formate lyase activating enzyme